MEQVCDLWLDETHDLHTQNKIFYDLRYNFIYSSYSLMKNKFQ